MSSAKIDLRCSDHSDYRAIRSQRVECGACEVLYALKHPERLEGPWWERTVYRVLGWFFSGLLPE